MKKIAIIGGGNLGSALAKGLIRSQVCKPQQLYITYKEGDTPVALSEPDINTGTDNLKAAKDANLIFIAVKPAQVKEVLKETLSSLSPSAIIISFASGVDTGSLSKWTDMKHPIFRAMPNTALSIGQSMTCLSSVNATSEQENEVKAIFEKLGSAILIPEELMSGATVLTGCGIAFALKYIRAATMGGIEIGFKPELALEIAAQTVKGAAELLLESGNHPEVEIDKVTTPGGITITGLNEMEDQGFSSALINGIISSFEKINKESHGE